MRLVVLVATLLLLPHASAAAPQQHRAPYTGQPAGVGCSGILEEGDCPNLANAAIQIGPFQARRLDLDIYDTSGHDVGASLTYYDLDGTPLGHAAVCGHADRLRLPHGAAYVVITLDMANSPKHCPRTISFATTGEVVATLRG